MPTDEKMIWVMVESPITSDELEGIRNSLAEALPEGYTLVTSTDTIRPVDTDAVIEAIEDGQAEA